MFTGSLIEDLVTTVAKTEANLATEWRVKEELENVPAFMLARLQHLDTRGPIRFGVA